MASCPKCGKAGIKKRNDARVCRRCGPLPMQPLPTEARQQESHA